jgi:hypothetical protein
MDAPAGSSFTVFDPSRKPVGFVHIQWASPQFHSVFDYTISS